MNLKIHRLDPELLKIERPQTHRLLHERLAELMAKPDQEDEK